MSNFGLCYSKLYDLFHEGKDYVREIDDLLQILNKLDKKAAILDFGCGSGKHALELSQRGYKVDGFDISSEMIALARNLTKSVTFRDKYEQMSSKYNVVYSLFDVMSYQSSLSLLTHYFIQISNLVLPGGIVVVDSWHQSGVRLSPPIKTIKQVSWRDQTIERLVEPTFSNSQDTYELRITLTDVGTKSVISRELHVLRAWSLEEVQAVIEKTGFKFISTFVPKQLSKKLEAKDWRFGVVMQKLTLPDYPFAKNLG